MRARVACLECLHRAPGGVQHPLLERVLHTHDLWTTKQEVKLLLLQLAILFQDGHTQLSCNNQLVTLKQTLRGTNEMRQLPSSASLPIYGRKE